MTDNRKLETIYNKTGTVVHACLVDLPTLRDQFAMAAFTERNMKTLE